MKKFGIMLTTKKEYYIMADNSMWFNFYISKKYTFDIDKMLNINVEILPIILLNVILKISLKYYEI